LFFVCVCQHVPFHASDVTPIQNGTLQTTKRQFQPTTISATTQIQPTMAKTEHEEHLEGMDEVRIEIFSRALRVKAWSIANNDAPQVPKGAGYDLRSNNVKIVHFVRHGQGFHNLMADVYRSSGRTWTSNVKSDDNPYTMPELVDAPLTEKGRQQAIELQPIAQSMTPQPQLVVLSPNCRALHTGCLVFEHLSSPLHNNNNGRPSVPFIAHEMVREEHGVHVCDQRRSGKRQALEFPHVDFSLLSTDEDTLWRPDHRETKIEVADRVYEFLVWLSTRPEQHVGVASHSAWLLTLFNACMDCQNDPKLLDWFQTGELRSVVLEFTTTSAVDGE
jgi:broad specificity phosphatase PhoE